MPPHDPGQPGVDRRSLVLGLAASCLLGGCGIQLEEDAPDIPLIPRREPVPLEAQLLALLTSTTALAASAASVGGALATSLAPIHTTQASLLRDVLLHGGVPLDDVDAATSAAARVAPASNATGLATAELADVRPPSRFAGAAPPLRATLLALCAQRLVAAHLLGAPHALVPGPPLPGAPTGQASASGTPAASAPSADSASAGVPSNEAPAGGAPTATGEAPTPTSDRLDEAPLGEIRLALARCRYLFQVAAARSSGAQRARASAVVQSLGARLSEVEGMLTTLPALPLGYSLPVPASDQAGAAALARRAAADLVAAYGRALPALTEGQPARVEAAFDLVAPWLAEAVVLGRQWGVPLTAFPGLSE